MINHICIKMVVAKSDSDKKKKHKIYKALKVTFKINRHYGSKSAVKNETLNVIIHLE